MRFLITLALSASAFAQGQSGHPTTPQPVSGSLTQSGNWSVTVQDGATASQKLSIDAQGRITVTGTFFQNTQPVSGTFWQSVQPISGTVAVSNFPASQAVTGSFFQATQPVSGTFWQSTQPVSIAAMPTTPVTGTFFQATQPISGTVGVNNFPATQTVSGTLSVGNFPASQTVAQATGTNLHVVVDSAPSTAVTGTFWPATQPVSGTFWQATQPVSIAAMPSTPVTGTFFQATQPVSIATMPSTPVTGTVGINNYPANQAVSYTGVLDPCASPFAAKSSVPVNASGTTSQQLIALSGATVIYVCHYTIVGGGTAPTLVLQYGTGTNCATGLTAFNTAFPIPATTFTVGWGGTIHKTAAGNALCTLLAGTSPTAKGYLTYVQQ